MGDGSYSNSARTERLYSTAISEGYSDIKDYMSRKENVFKQRSINNAMNPFGVKIRESRDSDEHPNSLAIIIGLDVTGSMGSVPHYLVREGLPKIMEGIIQAGIPDPQVLFVAVGDSNYDNAPLQIGQFESSDELLDKWLTDVYLEGGGGGNTGESYHLAWYFAARHTSIDCLEKRNQKGILFTIGDEPVLNNIPKDHLKRIMGTGQYSDMSAGELLLEASKKYETYHIHIAETHAGHIQDTIDSWKQLMHDNLLIAQHHDNVAKIITDTVLSNVKPGRLADETVKKNPEKSDDEEILL